MQRRKSYQSLEMNHGTKGVMLKRHDNENAALLKSSFDMIPDTTVQNRNRAAPTQARNLGDLSVRFMRNHCQHKSRRPEQIPRASDSTSSSRSTSRNKKGKVLFPVNSLGSSWKMGSWLNNIQQGVWRARFKCRFRFTVQKKDARVSS